MSMKILTVLRSMTRLLHGVMHPQAPFGLPSILKCRVRKSAVVCLVALFLTPSVPADEEAPSYKLRDRASVDKLSSLTEGSLLPLDKRYRDLSPAERIILHQQWENIPAGDEPPYPIDGLRPIHVAIARAQQALNVMGSLDLVVNVDATGEVTDVKAIGSPSAEMTKYAAAVMFNTKFKPAVCGGRPCAMQYPFSFVFKLS
jgi:hypothetical protein